MKWSVINLLFHCCRSFFFLPFLALSMACSQHFGFVCAYSTLNISIKNTPTRGVSMVFAHILTLFSDDLFFSSILLSLSPTPFCPILLECVHLVKFICFAINTGRYFAIFRSLCLLSAITTIFIVLTDFHHTDHSHPQPTWCSTPKQNEQLGTHRIFSHNKINRIDYSINCSKFNPFLLVSFAQRKKNKTQIEKTPK